MDAEDCQEFACSHTKLICEKSVNRLEVHKSKGNKFRYPTYKSKVHRNQELEYFNSSSAG
jgi:hypothetical protein